MHDVSKSKKVGSSVFLLGFFARIDYLGGNFRVGAANRRDQPMSKPIPAGLAGTGPAAVLLSDVSLFRRTATA
jgi:hypothetical protein